MNKKKKFVYNPIIPANTFQQTKTATGLVNHEFPEDVNSLVSMSQPHKKQKFDTDTYSKCKDANDMFSGIDFADDFDFSEAANEIDQIEIAASQQISTHKTKDKTLQVNLKEQPQQNSLTLKIPQKKQILPSTMSTDMCPSPLQSRPFCQQINRSPSFNQDLSFKDDKLIKEVDGSVSSEKDHLKKIQQELVECKDKLKVTEDKFYDKDGEIKILRESLRKISEEEHKYKETITKLEGDLKIQQTEKEKNLLKEVEKLKTQLEFKEREVKDAIEKQKKIVCDLAKKSIKVKLPIKDGPGSGFKNSTPNVNRNLSNSSNNTFLSQKAHHKFLSKQFQKTLDVGLKHLTKSREIVKSVRSKDFHIRSKISMCLCNPINESNSHVKENPLQFYHNLLSILELVETNSFFVTNLISHSCHSLKKLLSLFSKGQETSVRQNSLNQGFDNESSYSCSTCQLLYEHGLKIIHCVMKAAIVFPILQQYLLKGFILFEGEKLQKYEKKNESNATLEIDLKKNWKINISSENSMIAYTSPQHPTQGSNSSLLKDTDLDSSIQFWSLLEQLLQYTSAAMEEEIILLYTSLLSSDERCLCLVKRMTTNHTVSSYLNSCSLIRVSHVTSLFQNAVNIKGVNKLICTKSEKCPLLKIYNFVQHTDVTKESLIRTFKQLIQFMSSFIAANQTTNLRYLLEVDCQCSSEIIECLVTVLFDEFKFLQHRVFSDNALTFTEKERLSSFRQGISLLCILCKHDKALVEKRSAVESAYVYLLVGCIKMYRKIPDINDSEVLVVEDLLDMDNIDFDLQSVEDDKEKVVMEIEQTT